MVWSARESYFAAAMNIQTPIVKPIPILRTVDTTRPINAPLATRVASPADDPPVNSAMSAPKKEPRNAPITEPPIGTGIPTIAPTMPPRIAPQPARREPPYFRAKRPVSENSSSSATNASTATAMRVTQPIGSPGTIKLYATAVATIIQSPGRADRLGHPHCRRGAGVRRRAAGVLAHRPLCPEVRRLAPRWLGSDSWRHSRCDGRDSGTDRWLRDWSVPRLFLWSAHCGIYGWIVSR